MDILKLTPACKDYIWGGTKLKKGYGKTAATEKIAESWELSFHKDGPSMVGDEYLKDVVTSKQLGKNVDGFEFFPTLIKFIDAHDNLSVQVHPSDEYALKNENSYGKTEMWYIVEADDGAGIYFGFNRTLSTEEYEKAIKDGSITDLLNFVPVKAGDCYFIPSGTVHAIGKGCVILEIQQNSNLTYRVYDYKRKDINGNERPLHIEKALVVSNKHKMTVKKRKGETLGISKYFTVRKLDVKLKTLKTDGSTFMCVTCVKGSGEIDFKPFKAGDSFFVPADYGTFTIKGDATVITTEIRKYYLGIDVGGTSIKGGIVDDLGNIIVGDSIATERATGENAVIKIAALCKKMLDAAGMGFSDVAGLGVGIPGLIDRAAGKVVYSNNLGWKDLDIVEKLKTLTGLDVYIANDADAACLGEYKFGAGQGVDSCVMITLGTGVGSGVVIDKKLYTGNGGAGVEIGHTVIVKDGVQCNCGRKGCFEAYCSATALIWQTKRAMLENKQSKMWSVGILSAVTGKTAFDFYDDDETAKKVVNGYIAALSIGIVNVANAFRPQKVIIGGGLSAQKDLLIEPLQKAVDEQCFGSKNSPVCKVVAATTGNNAGTLGAAMLVEE